MARLLLKARPTTTQLADRLAPPQPDGLELYLDAADLADQAAMDGVLSRLERCPLPPEFSLIIEGPIGSLDGQFFHIGRQSEADVEVIRRLFWLGERLGVRAINLHPIAPEDQSCLTLARRALLRERSLPLLTFFADLAVARGISPTIENLPPVLRMRQGGYYFSAIGMLPEDFAYWLERIPPLRVCLDVSHAQLVVNAQNAGSAERARFPELITFLASAAPLTSLTSFVDRLGPVLLSAHISNASGLTGEGLPYSQGELDLDAVVRDLAPRVSFLVTETLEPNADEARFMREAQARMAAVLGDTRGR